MRRTRTFGLSLLPHTVSWNAHVLHAHASVLSHQTGSTTPLKSSFSGGSRPLHRAAVERCGREGVVAR